MAERSMKYESRFVKSADGTEIYTDAKGNCSASPTLVLIHGGCMVKAAFDPIFEDPEWTSRAFLVRYDTRGHGGSGKPTTDEAWDSRRMSEDFEAVCREFNVCQTFVLGWSVGASHFVDILNYNASVTILGLINVAGVVYIDSSIIARTARLESLEVVKRLVDPPSIDDFHEASADFLHLCSERFSPGLLRTLQEGILAQPRWVVGRLISRPQNSKKFLQEGREGNLPMLVLNCDEDKLVNVEGFEAVVRELKWKKCAYRKLNEADHVPWVSCPEAFRKVVLGWMSGDDP